MAVLILLLVIVFFREERTELSGIIPQIKTASPLWVATGIAITCIFIFFQAGIYKKSFLAVGLSLPWMAALNLFLKRNFLGIFLPAGSISALAYTPSQIRKLGFNKVHVYQASGLFGFAGLLTVFISGLPVVAYTFISGNHIQHSWVGLGLVLVILVLLFWVVKSLQQQGPLYKWVDRRFPSFTPGIRELFAADVSTRQFTFAILFSVGVEVCGMVHIYIAMLALGLTPSFGAAAAAYIIAVLMMVVSPFLKGLGAVELAMVFVLQRFGYSAGQALSVTILFRLFEFWLPMAFGMLSFAWVGRNLALRILPALLSFVLGIVNIISVVTPPITDRLHLVKEYLPLFTIHASNLLVLFIGLALLVTSGFLFKGLRNAWVIALGLATFSLIGHLTKALDYEEAIVAGTTLLMLLATGSQYRIRSSNQWMQAGIKSAIISFIAVLIFAYISFYFIDVRHFGVSFTWKQALIHTINSFLLVEDSTLQPITRFGHEFVWLIRSLGFITWGFLLFTLIRPYRSLITSNSSQKQKAIFLLSQFGNSPIDYFKVSNDKLLFFSDMHEAFIAYRIARGFAIVLEEPVCAEENKIDVLREFDRHCRKMGLKPAFYRVDENSIRWFNELKKQKLIIGQEGILKVDVFTLEGKDKKSLRNGLNSLQKKGYTVQTYPAPQSKEFLGTLKNVSDEWLATFKVNEIVFSQGMFNEKELAQQDVIALLDTQGQVKAFLNIIPNYAVEECTYDLIRKTGDAPGAAMDALIIQLVAYAKQQNKLYINLGLVPLTGINEPDNTAEQIIKIASEKIKRFQHYKGLREFKEKYSTVWENKFLVYDNDFDLLQLPLALKIVMKP